MIFPSIRMDSVVQVDDLFRIDLGSSKTSDGTEFTKIELKIGAADPLTIFDSAAEKTNYHTDWQFDSAGVKEMQFIFTHGAETKTVTKSITVLTEAEDKLFSSDEMISKLEPDIFNLLPNGRSSFKYAHRMAQEKILRELIEGGHEVTLSTLFDVKEISYWSRYMVLAFIFESNVTSGNDIHIQKRDTYNTLMGSSKGRVILSLDENQDGEVDAEVKTSPFRLRLV